jgi:hypothetical protein
VAGHRKLRPEATITHVQGLRLGLERVFSRLRQERLSDFNFVMFIACAYS